MKITAVLDPMPAAPGSVLSIARAGDAILATLRNATLRRLDASGGVSWRLPLPPPGTLSAVAGGERLVLTAYKRGTTLLDRATGATVAELDGWHVAPSARDHVRCASGEPHGAWRIWDARTGTRVAGLPFAIGVALAPDGTRAAVQGRQGVEVWEIGTDGARCVATHTDRLLSLLPLRAIGPDGRTVLAGCEDGIVKAWDLETGEQRWSDAVGAIHPRLLRWSADGRRALSADAGGGVRVWDATTGERIAHVLLAPASQARDACFARDAGELVAICADGRLRRYEIATGRLLATLAGIQSSSAACDRDGGAVMPGFDDVRVEIRADGSVGIGPIALGDALAGDDPDDPDQPVEARLSDGRSLWWLPIFDQDESWSGTEYWIEPATTRMRDESFALVAARGSPRVLARSHEQLVLVDVARRSRSVLPLDAVPTCAVFAHDERTAWVGTAAGSIIRVAIDAAT